MQLDEFKLKDVLTLAAALTGSTPQKPRHHSDFFVPGKKYFIRTVTHHQTGECVAINEQEVVLKDAAWIADDGRFTQALESCVFNEVEMFPKGLVLVGRGSIIDACEIAQLPTSQK